MINGTHYSERLQTMRLFYNSGITRPASFRKQQLLLLKNAILQYEEEINHALYADLKKSPEEVYATEIGILLSEINVVLKNLHKWVKPQKIKTNLLNFPSRSKIYHDPLGIVLIIAPWNYPLQLSFIPLIGAIAGGNCAVVKPSEFAPATASVIETIIQQTFSSDYIKVVQGDGSVLIPGMMQQFRFNHIFYTGSTAVGKLIYQAAAKDLVPVTLELGGKSPAIVEEDANLKTAARRIVFGKFTNAGQTCIAPDYLLVQENVASDLIKELKNAITTFFGTDIKQNHDYGRIISSQHFDRVNAYLKDGTVIYGGNTDKDDLYIEPTLLENVPLDSSIMANEIFGPLLPIIKFKHREEALNIVQSNDSPLAFYLFTLSRVTEQEWIKATSFGGGCINNTVWQYTNHYFPFGGIGNSGIGKAHGKYSFKTFTHAKPVMRTPSWFDPSIKYPPFKGKLKLIKRLIK